jgi:hypothetical protein
VSDESFETSGSTKTIDSSNFAVKDSQKFKLYIQESSEWSCYLFGNRPGGPGLMYTPRKGGEPNWFVRWMMRICFDSLWVKKEK